MSSNLDGRGPVDGVNTSRKIRDQLRNISQARPRPAGLAATRDPRSDAPFAKPSPVEVVVAPAIGVPRRLVMGPRPGSWEVRRYPGGGTGDPGGRDDGPPATWQFVCLPSAPQY
ncbi:hypothetical protein GCM10009577_64970 [Streptomyces javensis]